MKSYDKDKFVSDSIRITPEEFQADEKRVEEGEERRVFAMIAMQIRRELRKQGITQAEFAKRLGVDPSIVTRYLSGKHNFQLRTLVKVQKILDIEIINNWYYPKRNEANASKSKVHVLICNHKSVLEGRYDSNGISDSDSDNTSYKMVINEQQLIYNYGNV